MELGAILLDTSAYSAFKRGHDEALAHIRSAGRIFLPVVVIGELLAGFEGGSKRDQNRSELDAFCASPRVIVPPLTRSSAERYAAIYHYLRAAGTPVPTNDLWISAVGMELGAVIVTMDGHFKLIPQIISVVLSVET